MRIILSYILFILLHLSIFAQGNFQTDSQVQQKILKQDDFKSAGIINISDILTLVNDWQLSSIDGYSYAVSPNNLSPYQNQNLIVTVDGQRYDMNNQDFINLNLIPLSIDQIDSVIIISSPQLFNNEFTAGGLINIITKKPAQGLSFNFFGSVGNEVGDPGPYIFTQEKSTNVDKLGYLLSFNLNTSGKDWYLRTFVKTEENFMTDRAIIDRISGVSDDTKTNMIAASAILDFNALKGEHHLLFGYTENDGFIFYNYIGNELPNKNTIKHIGLNGEITFNNQLGLNYFIKKSNNRIGNRESSKISDFNWESDVTLVRVEGNYKTSSIFTSIGLSYEDDKIIRDDRNNRFDNLRLFGKINHLLNKNFNYVLDVSTTKYNNDYSFNAALKNFWYLNQNNKIVSNFSFSQTPPLENLLYRPIISDDYQNLTDNIYLLNNLNENINNSLFAVDLNYYLKPSRKIKLSFGANYRHFFDYTLEKFEYQFNPDEKIFSSTVELKTDEWLKVIGGIFEIDQKISEVVNHSLFYNYQTDLSGSDYFNIIWQTIPKHKFIYSINIQPDKNFGIWARFRYQSAVEWAAYKYIEYQSNQKYISEVDPLTTIDISLQKWFWERRVWLNLVFRNILNNREYFHPVGAGFDLRFYLQLHVYLHSILI